MAAIAPVADPPESLALFVDAAVAGLRLGAATSLPALGEAARLLRATGGLVAATGCGKSAFVARKFASTLSTLGRRAFFLDACAAAHGDAGLLRPEDLLVAFSRSGETDEIVALALGAPCPVIALTARPKSRLGRAARKVVPLGDAADPVPGLPTVSWLAMALVAELLVCASTQGPGEETAGPVAHPAGAVGRSRGIQVARVMHAAPLVTPETPFGDVLRLLTTAALGAVVLAEDGRLRGILTDGDLRRAVERRGESVFACRACEMATPTPVVVRASAGLGEAMELMERRESQISVLPVVDEAGLVVGLLRLHDLVQAGMG
jgi:arabinose-5-phosphate isomerase